jgi:WD40 repeat protein
MSHTGGVYGAAFNPDETKLLTHGGDGCLKEWDCTNGNLIRTVQGLSTVYPSYGSQIAWSTAGDRIALIANSKLLLFDYPNLKEILRIDIGEAQSTRFLASDKLMVVMRRDQLELRNATTGAFVENIFAQPQPGIREELTAVYESRLAYCDPQGVITVRDFKTNRTYPIPKPDSGVMSLHFIDAGRRLVISCGGLRKVRKAAFMTPPTMPSAFADVFDIESGKSVKHFGPTLEEASSRDGVREISPDGKFVVLARPDRTDVYDTVADLYLTDLPPTPVRKCIFSKSGSLLAVPFEDAVEIWSTKTWTPAFDHQGHSMAPEAVAASADGSLVATSARDGVRLWNAKTGQHLWQADRHELARLLPKNPKLERLSSGWPLELKFMCFSADNQTLFGLEGFQGSHVLALEVATGKVQRIVWTAPNSDAHLSHRPEALRFTQDCQRLLVSGRETYLVDPTTGQTLWTNPPRKIGSPIYWPAFSPNGKLLARMSSKSILTAMEIPSGVEKFSCELNLPQPQRFPGGVTRLRFITSGLLAVYVWPEQDRQPSRLILVEVASGQPCAEYAVQFGNVLISARSGEPLWIAGGGYGNIFELSLRKGTIVADTGLGYMIDGAFFVGDHGYLLRRRSSAVICPLPPVQDKDGLAKPLDRAALDACWNDLAADPRTAWQALTELAKTDGDWPKLLADRLAQGKVNELRAVRLTMALGMSPNPTAYKTLKQLADRPDESRTTTYAKELTHE